MEDNEEEEEEDDDDDDNYHMFLEYGDTAMGEAEDQEASDTSREKAIRARLMAAGPRNGTWLLF
jgi:hypothetical protein